jgi:cobalt-zinc-cadmium efflux system membrane fusion protein
VLKAIQQVDGKDVVFVAKQSERPNDFTPIPVQIGQRTQDGQWVEITQGLTAGNNMSAR